MLRGMFLINMSFLLKIIPYFTIGYLRCVYGNYRINKYRFTINKYNNLNYSTLINKGSFEYLNFKQHISLSHELLDFSRDIYINKIADLLILILNIDFSRLVKICKIYNITGEDITKRIIKQSQFGDLLTSDLKKKIKKNKKLVYTRYA